MTGRRKPPEGAILSRTDQGGLSLTDAVLKWDNPAFPIALTKAASIDDVRVADKVIAESLQPMTFGSMVEAIRNASRAARALKNVPIAGEDYERRLTDYRKIIRQSEALKEALRPFRYETTCVGLS